MKPLSEEEIAAGWKLHDGVKCPVGPYRHVDIMWSDRYVGKGHAAGAHQWGQFKDETASIFAYRIVDEDKVLLGEALKAAVHEGVEKLGGKTFQERLSVMEEPVTVYDMAARENEKEALYADPSRYEQNKAMGDDKPAKDLRQLGRFSHHDTAYTTHVFYDEHPIAMITDDVISWSYHMPDMKKAASEAMHVYLGRVWK